MTTIYLGIALAAEVASPSGDVPGLEHHPQHRRYAFEYHADGRAGLSPGLVGHLPVANTSAPTPHASSVCAALREHCYGTRPIASLREAHQVMRTVLDDGAIDFKGDFYGYTGSTAGSNDHTSTPTTEAPDRALGPCVLLEHDDRNGTP
jgi:hypothetical protein